ncbi:MULTISPECIES: cation:proton antiporter domain-containing protein [Hymenobacter]|uniref:Sodium:proton antiporter n=1 Tax=Hymenobacter armeniacus TaxID=2771358 RepID=A0ABR8JNV2_9BACT|nr:MULTISPECIES: sodium:proton antiporter [Hymenobacter]MBD2720725.1 sodium:proton antiporter [Hymenobacter armeniacus]MBJ6109937.1 sodium:proton antiporter [Hymenobacter sp. BT523]
MGPYTILIGLSLAVLLSYVFDLAARATKVPSVLMLLLAGIALSQAAAYWGGVPVAVPPVLLQLFGIVGLILIVLEGSLDLRLTRDKAPLIRRSFLAAVLIMGVQVAAIAALLHFYVGARWQSSLLNAVPLAVVSSAVAIPSVAGLGGDKQEFIVYESTFSDIVGIMLFNFILQDDFAQGWSVVTFGRDVLAVAVVAVLSTALLAWLLGRLRSHVKFFLLFAFLVLIYSIAKMLHLSSLVLVLAFGLAVNNADQLLQHPLLRRFLHPEQLARELHQLKSITAESAFLIRTFFFLLFGYSITLSNLASVSLLLQGALIVGVLTLVRYVYLRYVARTDLVPELFIAPKGLISVLLFYSIPARFLIGEVSENILFVVILLTGLLMMVGLQLARKAPELGEY